MADQLELMTLANFNKGHLERQFQGALREVIRSIQEDEFRDPEAAREITLKLRIEHKDDAFRTTSDVVIKPPPFKKRGGMAAIRRGDEGHLQLYTFNDGEQTPLFDNVRNLDDARE